MKMFGKYFDKGNAINRQLRKHQTYDNTKFKGI